MKKQRVVILACSIFKCDLEELTRRGCLHLPIVYLDSMLHMKPEELHQKLLNKIAQLRATYDCILLLYGDCHAYMHDAYKDMNVYRVQGSNCCEIMLGHTEYHKLRKAGAFIVFDEWAGKWEHIFKNELGFNDKIAPIFMGEAHSQLLYLDTGLNPIPHKEIEDMSKFFNLTYDIQSISLDFLLTSINQMLERILLDGPKQS